MHIVLWSLLILFVLSLTVGGLVGGANIIDELLGRVDPTKAIGVVNGEVISPENFSSAVGLRLEQIRATGQTIGEGQIELVRNEIWNNFVENILLEQSVVDLGITVSDAEILHHLEADPPSDIKALFTREGQFDEEAYRQALNDPRSMNWVEVEQWMRNFYIPRFKLQQYLNSSVPVTEDEIRKTFIKRNIAYTINALHVTRETVNESVPEPGEEELRSYYKSRPEEYHREEGRSLSYVSWEKKPSAQDSLQIFEDVQELKRRAQKGADFAALADEFSQDPGNRVTPDSGRGGELGWFERNQMVPPFEEAAFGAQPGEIVGPVLSPFGYHIIAVHDKRLQEEQEQVKAAHILLKIEIGPGTVDALRRQATLFAYDAQDYGFEATLDTHGVVAAQTVPITRETVFIPGLGSYRTAARFAFNAEPETVSDPLESDRYYAVFRLDKITPAGRIPFDEVQEQIKATLQQEKLQEAARALAYELRARLDAGSLFSELKAENQDLEEVKGDRQTLTRGFTSLGSSAYLIGALLHSQPGDLIGPLPTTRGYALVKLVAVEPFDSTGFEIQRGVIKNDLLARERTQTFRNWMQNLKNQAKITDNRHFYY